MAGTGDGIHAHHTRGRQFSRPIFFDVRPSLKRIRVEGMYLDEQELFDLRRSLETIRDIIHFLTLTSNDEEQEKKLPLPCPTKLAGDIIVFPQLITRINNILDKFGKSKTTLLPNYYASAESWPRQPEAYHAV